ncbi:MAG: histidinol dehydrogenase, partial [Eubacteriales bacterium]|nr:histidinol dehydrogenase [Eubacteriales bacterium]
DISLKDILLRNAPSQNVEVEEIVRGIVEDVRNNGDNALLAYCKKFDGVTLSALAVSKEEIDRAMKTVDQKLLAVIEKAAVNISAFHSMQKREGFTMQGENGVTLGQRFTPIENVGIYVPGGTASYPSSVLMNAIPAHIAGAKNIVMATPPAKDGSIPPAILAAARIAGVTQIFKMGGAQAIAAMAYGTESVPRVDKIVGPGNIFVATAKRQVFGMVAIDMIAGPSEILVIADSSAKPRYVAADLLSQAEHDKLSAAVLVTNSPALAAAVSEEIERQLALLPRNEIARAAIDGGSKIILVESLEEAVTVSNAIAPEHLELFVKNPEALLPLVQNAGSIFMGAYTPEALGDYLAGPNHILPTNGTARFSSPLGVDDFIKRSSFICYNKEALRAVKDSIDVFANAEGLQAHAKSALIRYEEEN